MPSLVMVGVRMALAIAEALVSMVANHTEILKKQVTFEYYRIVHKNLITRQTG